MLQVAQRHGHVARQLSRQKDDHEGCPSFCALCEFSADGKPIADAHAGNDGLLKKKGQ
jgi:hypothetical protein